MYTIVLLHIVALCYAIYAISYLFFKLLMYINQPDRSQKDTLLFSVGGFPRYKL